MVTLSIKTDFRNVQRELKSLQSDIKNKVIPTALNKIAAKAKTEMKRAISSEFNIPQDEVNARLRITRAKRDFKNWFVVLDPFASKRKGRSLNLIRFVEKSVTLAEGRRRNNSGTTLF